ncbi:transglutaminase TgpA family protein [Oceanobacillus chungangensis]|uniref:Transglutaminase-like domain-containing protein n=1 Tax=Oceanobacillus chungangensis TaxID=1229152 RepID=A0A3D8PTL8_9BACI|nr:transglutaminase domain-containing protein [Oceanobacillus chungangensis]RDW18917.1 hypothetical protein CWR45_08865 [Oceanobacillus chungangensis]
MSKFKKIQSSTIYASILYILGLLLFLEWLYPIQDVTDTEGLTLFIIYSAFCFFISMFQFKWWISFLLKGLAMVLILNGLYFDGPIWSNLWFEQLRMEFTFNFEALFSQSWYTLTPLFRSFLFLLLIWLMSYLLYYWFVQMKRIFLFVLLTIIYLAVLDTFTVYDGAMSIVRTFIISLLALGIANFMKEIDMESIRFQWLKRTPIWLLPIIAIALFSTIIGVAAPKLEPQWPDPVPFIQSAAEKAGGGNSSVIQKVGYGEDDSRLGGSFIQDDTHVFYATVKDEQYWRIESKDVYTGKGWELSAQPNYEPQPNGNITFETFNNTVVSESMEGTIELTNTKIGKLIYPYGMSKVYGEAEYALDEQSGAIELSRPYNEDTIPFNYKIDFESPSYSINELRESSEPYPTEISNQYTQLPPALPERVALLAEQITASYDNRYDKVKAVENYFGSNGFVYQTTDVPIPEQNQDYVDQFLFDSKVGYCDNYSTSMVVLLRTLDIPARWVKGFASGEIVERGEASYEVYKVTNENAHSWVEVYFPEVGWVPFEPTQGFANTSDFHMDTEGNREALENDAMTPTPESQDPEEQMEEPEKTEKENASSRDREAVSFSINWWYVAVGLVILAAVLFIIYKSRFRWQMYLISLSLGNKQDAKSFQEAYHFLMKILSGRGFEKEPSQTLREFAKRVDERYSTNEMGQLTSNYERMLYKNEIEAAEIQKLTKLWKDLIKRIMG